MSRPKRALLYARISDARGDGRSVEDQERDMRATARRLGWTVGEILREPDTSAFKRRRVTLPDGSRVMRVVRPEFRRALDMLGSGRGDALLAYDLDRACRDPRDLEDLIDVVEECGIPVESVTGSLKLSSDAEVTMARVMVAVANKASRDTSRRVRRAAQTRAEEGGNHGGRRAFGYEKHGLTLRDAEAAVIREAAESLFSGRSLRSIVADLQRRNVATVTGRPWTPIAFRSIMLRPRNAGIATYKGDPVGRGKWEPIYDEDTHRRVVALLTDPSRRTSPGNTVRWLGSGLYRCGVCGATMRCSRAGNRQPAYRCTKSAHLVRDAASLDRAVTAALLNVLDDPRALRAMTSPEQQAAPAEANAAARDLVRLGARLDQLKAALRDPDADDIQDLRLAMSDVRERIADAENRLTALHQPDVLAPFESPDADVVDTWLGLSLEQQRSVMDALAVVTVNRARRGRRPGATRLEDGSFGDYFDPAAVEIAWTAVV